MIKAFQVFKSWCVDTLINHAPTIITLFVTGGGATYIASLSEPLQVYGLIAWVLIGVFVSLSVGLMFVCVGYWRDKTAMADFTNKSLYSNASNPLSPVHENERIKLADFYHPYYRAGANIRFQGCDLMGPVNLYAEGGTFDNCHFNECEIVVVRGDRSVRGVVALRNPTLVNCHLYRITFLMPIEQYKTLPPQMKAGVPVISDGRVGDI